MITVMLFSELWSEVCHARLSDYKTAVSVWGQNLVSSPAHCGAQHMVSAWYMLSTWITMAGESCALSLDFATRKLMLRAKLILWLQLWASRMKLFPDRNWHCTFSLPSYWALTKLHRSKQRYSCGLNFSFIALSVTTSWSHWILVCMMNLSSTFIML